MKKLFMMIVGCTLLLGAHQTEANAMDVTANHLMLAEAPAASGYDIQMEMSLTNLGMVTYSSFQMTFSDPNVNGSAPVQNADFAPGSQQVINMTVHSPVPYASLPATLGLVVDLTDNNGQPYQFQISSAEGAVQ